MPLYDFQCPRCKRTTEMLLKPEEHPGSCANCMDVELIKLPPAPGGFILKGEGFYKPTSNEETS